jgi:hypothetical protein
MATNRLGAPIYFTRAATELRPVCDCLLPVTGKHRLRQQRWLEYLATTVFIFVVILAPVGVLRPAAGGTQGGGAGESRVGGGERARLRLASVWPACMVLPACQHGSPCNFTDPKPWEDSQRGSHANVLETQSGQLHAAN